MKKLKKLNDAQVALFSAYRDRWIDIGLSTTPADHILAEQYITQAYGAAGLKAPKTIIRLGSPLAGAYGAALLTRFSEEMKTVCGDSVVDSVRDSVRDSVGDSVWASVGDSVGDSVWASVWDLVWASVGDSVRASVRASVWDSVGDLVGDLVVDSVRDSVWDLVWDSVVDSVRASVRASVGDSVVDSVRDSVGDSVRASVRASVRDSVRDSVGRAGFGQHDAGWLSFYNYFLEVTELECCKKLLPLMKLAEVAGWWWPFGNAVIITEKTKELHRDARGRLHRENGPALVYPDGWALYRWHGVEMPKYYIETPSDQIDIHKALAEGNASVRMAAIQKCGFLRVKNQIPNQLISKTDSADLLEFDLQGMKVRGLHVRWEDKFKTPLETIIPVPRTKTQFGEDCPENIDDAEAVRRWTLHMKPQERLVIET